MDIQKAKNIYMVGIKGVGMASLALILQKMGKHIWGSDINTVYQTDTVLLKNGIKVLPGFTEQNISKDIDIVITTAAHGGLSNIEVLFAKKQGIPVLSHAEALGVVMDQFTTKIAVCGTHGKTTVSAMTSFVFNELKLKLGYHVGASTFSGMDGGGFTGYDYFVSEADEYVAEVGNEKVTRFMSLNPDIIICTSIDYDHPDVYPSYESMEKAYINFFNKLEAKKGTLIYCADDPKVLKIVSQFSNLKTIPYSLKNAVDIELLMPGDHNKLNAAAVITLAHHLGLDDEAVKKALSKFTGLSRRFEKIYEKDGTYLYDDYAHHPTEISAAIDAFRDKYPDKRLIIIFQSHTYSRTEALKDDFILSLSKADRVLLTDIFASAREKSALYSITSESMVEDAKTKGIKSIEYCGLSAIVPQLSSLVRKGDVVVTMGAGSLYELHSGIIDVLNKL